LNKEVLFVCPASVYDLYNQDKRNVIANFIDDAIIAVADAPVTRPFEFFDSWRAWIA